MRRAVSLLWGAEAVGLIGSALQAILVARWLGPESLGQAALILAIPGLVFAVVNPHAEEAVVQFASRFRAQEREGSIYGTIRLAKQIDVGLIVVGAVITLAAMPVALRLTDLEGRNFGLVLVAALGAGLASMATTYRAVLSVTDRFPRLASLNLVTGLARSALVVWLVSVTGLGGYVVGLTVAAGLELSLLALASRYAARPFGDADIMPLSGSDRRDFLRFLLFTDLSTVASVLIKHADVLVLGAFRPPAEVGEYRLAATVVSLLGRVSTPLQTVAFPRLSSAAVRGGRHFDSELRLMARNFSAPLAVAGLVGAPVLAWLLPRVAGTAYRGAVDEALWLYVGAVVSVVLFWVRPGLLAARAERPLFILSSMGSVATASAFVLVADMYGSVGVAASRATIAGMGATMSALAILRRQVRVMNRAD